MRAYAAALQSSAGPVFLSLPLDDWDKEMPRSMLESVRRGASPPASGRTLNARQSSPARIEGSVRPVPGLPATALRPAAKPSALAWTADDVTAAVGEALKHPGASVVADPIARHFHSLPG
jgi:thiamine pyrophosphate-dependent acetolactate synthase large subunit-like protein